MAKELVNLCKCNNCGTIMIDQNPQIGAPAFVGDVTKIADMQYIDNKEEGGFWACGICETDGYLTDDISKKDESDLRQKDLIS